MIWIGSFKNDNYYFLVEINVYSCFILSFSFNILWSRVSSILWYSTPELHYFLLYCTSEIVLSFPKSFHLLMGLVEHQHKQQGNNLILQELPIR